MESLWSVIALAVVAAPEARLTAQVQTNVPEAMLGAKAITGERIKVRGDSLEGNLEGDAVERDVIVFLRSGYAKNKTRRHPVVFALHGYSIGADQWTHEVHVPQTIEGAFLPGRWLPLTRDIRLRDSR